MDRANIIIRPAQPDELDRIYSMITLHQAWTQFNGPYFPYEHPSKETFRRGGFSRLVEGKATQLIVLDGVPIGTVSCYWECEETRWLEAGIVIYDTEYWGQGIARIALPMWITYLFSAFEIERVGLTTWSGNPRMMACALKLGFKQEARLRKVRYYKNEYYDSLKYGVLRSEWESQP
ncbi:GNAT family N-acetyltransferase [Vibrio ostreicida]|uniref:GNAT family protein n=1 Tax=Vibrio ostreicida TaxID=526588 RepID=A0ABT8BUS9_9VIBR|nr:GNAT family protein [Vibrio ostreicida]MDN3609835.1 GNAT family protein [Vibrio ostreicida]MDN3611165.1 GNAT family protein [Vibrio ostreicida]NPD09344.1 GNAT family N-acetyltransferase [Vibrio ostreicida]